MNPAKLAPHVLLASLALAACGGDSPQPKMPANSPVPQVEATRTPDSRAGELANPGMTNTDPSSATGIANSASASATMAPASSPPTSTPEPLSDPEIAAITHTVNMGEIEEGKVAMGKAKDAKVKKFADMMVKHHTQANKDAQSLATKMKLTPQENAMTREMKTKAQDSLAELKGKSGADFDRAYVEGQIKEHTEVLATIDGKLMPNAKSTELKTFLQQLRPRIQMHLDEATQLKAQLK